MTDDLVGREKTVRDAFLEAVRVEGVAEVAERRDLPRLLRRCGQPELDRAGEVVEDRAPRRVLAGAAAMAFVDDDQVEEVRAELPVDVQLFFGAGTCQRV